MEKEKRKEIVIVQDGHGQRLDAYLAAHFVDQTRSQIQKLIDSGDVLLRGKPGKNRDRVSDGDEIVVNSLVVQVESTLKPFPVPLKILFEDSQLVVIDKPAGLVVHPGAGTVEPTLVEGLLYHLGEREQIATSRYGERPGIVHRLDKDTSGVLVCSKNPVAHTFLSKQFEEKTNLREYIALLKGHLAEDEQMVTSYLGRDPKDRKKFISISEDTYQQKTPEDKSSWRKAVSNLKVRKRYTVEGIKLSLVDFRLSTGRTHQIRLHAHSIGHGVWGDPLYGKNRQNAPDYLASVKRQLLHARFLGFVHPESGEKVAFEADVPDDFALILNKLNALS